FFCLCIMMTSTALAQDDVQDVAALLTVTYPGVEVRRVDTDAWIALSQGAVTPFGTGDSVRTDETGRALISFGDDSDILVLPAGQFNFGEVNSTPEGILAQIGVITGQLIIQARENTFADLSVALDWELARTYSQAIIQDGFSAVSDHRQTTPIHVSLKQFDAAALYVVAEGQMGFVGETAFANFTEGNAGAYGRPPDADNLSSIEFPFNVAQVEGELYGCPGTVTTDGRDLNARNGPGTANVQYGQFPNGADVFVMGLVESGGWYRVQYRSGFGWVQRLAVDLMDPDCELATLPDDAFDIPNRVINPTEREIELLAPFYGTPDDDPIFYRFE
ncbi:MAG: SH3 domain-containing protein, partial [Chloroflexota bacterium]